MRSTCRHLHPSGRVFLLFSCSELESLRVPSESVGAVEDRKKVPWSDKETIILLEIWGDTQVGRGSRAIRSRVSVELWDISSSGAAEHTPVPSQRPRLHRNFRETAGQRLLPDAGAVPLQNQAPEKQLPAVPGQHQVGAARLRSVGPLLTGPASQPRRLRCL